MSGPEARHERAGDGDAPQRYATVVIVGGGCYGSYYVRQLRRAVRAGAVAIERLVVVDRDGACAVSHRLAEADAIPVALVIEDWRAYFDAYLEDAAAHGAPGDAIVPSPLMPHLMGEWLVRRARQRAANRVVETRPIDAPIDVPWQRAGADGTQYVSFATWECPINCIEPRICPHTRGERTWSLPVTLDAHARRHEDVPIVAAVMHCRHRAYGVGMFDTAEVVAADSLIAEASRDHGAEALIGTVSHCHGALTRLVIGPPTGDCGSVRR